MSKQISKIALVTGGSSGIGQAASIALKNKGCTVYEISRHQSNQEGINHLTADVTDEASVIQAVETILSKEGRIDILVNCAGFGIAGAVEFTTTETAKAQFEVNFFGMVNVNRAILPVMRKQQAGRIINVSSVAAVANIPFQAYYSATKAAIDSYSLALRNEVKPFGISVCSVQPGDIKTGFTSARKSVFEGDDVYNGKISRSIKKMEQDEQNGMSPEIAGKFIAKTAFKSNVKPVYAVDFISRIECFLLKILPRRLSNFIVGKMYAK